MCAHTRSKFKTRRISPFVSSIIHFKSLYFYLALTSRKPRTRPVRPVLPTYPPTATTHAAPSSPRPARALNVVVFMQYCDRGSGRATAGREGGSKTFIFYAFSCAFMHFFAVFNKMLGGSARRADSRCFFGEPPRFAHPLGGQSREAFRHRLSIVPLCRRE